MDTTSNTRGNNTMNANDMQISSLLKLFGDDPDGKLQEARDKIYSYVWSRDRRDTCKLDWVLSQNGVNRNVPERFIEDTPYGQGIFKTIDELPCGLILTNKEISADFTRYIYSVNDLEIDVDLKAIYTAENEDKLHRITTLLQNPNFIRFTKNVRVRIHFPDKYPFQSLPAFNQRVLENIATILDGFEQIEHLAVRIVSMQGPLNYELRLAAFPFYPMSLTDWSIRMLNDTTWKWEIVGGEQLDQLNLAWDEYKATGSLTAQVNTGAAGKKSVPGGQTLAEKGNASLPKKQMTTQHINGSQKRKARKMRGVSATATNTGLVSRAQNVAETSSPSSTVPAPLSTHSPILSSNTELPESNTTSQTVSTTPESSREISARHLSPKLPFVSAAGPSMPTSPQSPTEPSNIEPSGDPSSSDTSGEMVMTPCNSSVESPEKIVMTTAITQLATKIQNTDEFLKLTESKTPQTLGPASPAPSSVTSDQSLDDAEILSEAVRVPNVATVFSDELDNKKPTQKKKRGTRKKPKKSKATITSSTSLEGVEDKPAAAGVQMIENENGNDTSLVQDRFNENQDNPLKDFQVFQIDSSTVLWNVNTNLDVPLSELTDLELLFDGYCIATKADGTKIIIRRTREASWYLRQKERRIAARLEKEAEMMKAKEKRLSKKVKETFIRRRDPSQNLRRQVEDTKQQKAIQQSNCSNQLEYTSGSDDSHDMGNDSPVLCSSVEAATSMTVRDTDQSPIELSGESEDGVDEYDATFYTDATSLENEHPQSSQLVSGTQSSAHTAEIQREGTAAAVSTKDNSFQFEGRDIHCQTEQEIQGHGGGYANMDSLDKRRISAYKFATSLTGVYSKNQYRRNDRWVEEQRIIEEIDEPGDSSVSVEYSPDDEVLVPQDDDGANDEQ